MLFLEKSWAEVLFSFHSHAHSNLQLTKGVKVHNVQRQEEFNDPASSRQRAPVLSRPSYGPIKHTCKEREEERKTKIKEERSRNDFMGEGLRKRDNKRQVTSTGVLVSCTAASCCVCYWYSLVFRDLLWLFNLSVCSENLIVHDHMWRSESRWFNKR